MTPTLEFPEIKELDGKIADRRAKLKAIFDEAGPELDMGKVKGYANKTEVVAEIRGLNDELAELGKSLDDAVTVRKGLQYATTESWERHAEGFGREGQSKSLGQRFAESPSRLTKNVETELAVDLKTLFQRSAGWEPESLRDPGYVAAASAPLMIMDLIPQIPTSQSAVKYMEQTTRTNNAAERAEGAVYGEAAFVLTQRTIPVETIGVWLPVTDEQMEDEEEAAAMIDMELPFMVRQRLDLQLLVGDGSTPNIRGVNNVSGIQTHAKSTDPVFDAIHKGLTKVRVTGRAIPNAVVFHPNDWQDIRLTRTADGIYILGNPSDAAPERIFGLRAAISDNQTENTAVVGDFANFSRLRTKRDIVVERTISNADDFTKGKQAVRAGIRCAAVWTRAAAFCTVTGI